MKTVVSLIRELIGIIPVRSRERENGSDRIKLDIV
jgi:hypothetical protein